MACEGGELNGEHSSVGGNCPEQLRLSTSKSSYRSVTSTCLNRVLIRSSHISRELLLTSLSCGNMTYFAPIISTRSAYKRPGGAGACSMIVRDAILRGRIL
jgi:hypothetical protein